MKIQKLIITENERNLAVEEYLANRFNINVKVTNVDKNYGGGAGLSVEVEVEEVKNPATPAPPSKQFVLTGTLQTGEDCKRTFDTEGEAKVFATASGLQGVEIIKLGEEL